MRRLGHRQQRERTCQRQRLQRRRQRPPMASRLRRQSQWHSSCPTRSDGACRRRPPAPPTQVRVCVLSGAPHRQHLGLARCQSSPQCKCSLHTSCTGSEVACKRSDGCGNSHQLADLLPQLRLCIDYGCLLIEDLLHALQRWRKQQRRWLMCTWRTRRLHEQSRRPKLRRRPPSQRHQLQRRPQLRQQHRRRPAERAERPRCRRTRRRRRATTRRVRRSCSE